MKTYYLIGLVLALSQGIQAQVNVYDCAAYTRNVSQADIDAQNTIYGNCVVLGDDGDIHVQDNADKSIFAYEEITLKDGVHLGGFDVAGGVHLKITPKSDLNISVMNYPDLYNVLRYKKLEFGIELPTDILTRVNHFLFQKGTYKYELNPFVDWNVDLEATFTHVASGTVKTVNGFYTREYIENPTTDDWDDIGTNYPFRVRFAPPLNGEWQVQISIRVNNEQTASIQSSDFYFNTIESGDLGYVTVFENNANLKRGNKMIFPIGVNIPSPDEHAIAYGGDANYLGHNHYGPNNTEKACNTQEWNLYLDKVENYFKEGGKYIRTIQFPWSSLLEFEERGNYYKRLHYAYEQDKLLDLCSEYDASLMFNFMYQACIQTIAEYGANDWDWDRYEGGAEYPYYLPDMDTDTIPYSKPVYCYNDDPSWKKNGQIHHGKKVYEMFTDSVDLRYHKQRIRYYIARYGYSTNISVFEILSEPFHIGQMGDIESTNRPYQNTTHPEYTMARTAVNKYHQVISEYLRDSLQIDQLIGADIQSGREDYVKDPLEDYIGLPKLDIIGINPYTKGPADVYGLTDFVLKIRLNRVSHGVVPVPILFSEGGTDEGYQGCSNYAMHPADMMTFPFTGTAGYMTWYGYKEPNYASLWSPIIRTQYHMNGTDVINTLSEGGGSWGHGMQEAYYHSYVDIGIHQTENYKRAVEIQYYVSSDQDKIIGYVKNRTYNVYTLGVGNSPCKNTWMQNKSPLNTLWNIKWDEVQLGKRLKVTNMPSNAKYNIDFYSYKEGNYISSTTKSTGQSGKLRIEYPELVTHDKPLNSVIWFVARRLDNSELILTPNEVENAEALLLNERKIALLDENNRYTFSPWVYPIPFGDYLVLESTKDDIVDITDALGRKIGRYIVSTGANSIDTKEYASGTYYAKYVKQNVTFKILKR